MVEIVEIVGDSADPSNLVIDPGRVESSILDFFLNYWRSRKGSSTLPIRSSFVPQEIRGNLPWVVVVDALPDFTDFRYRVIGSHVARYFLGNTTGLTAREAFADWGEEAVADVVAVYARACTERAPVRLAGPAIARGKLRLPAFDALYLPYSSDGETPDRVINIFTFDQKKLLGRGTAVGLGAG